MDGSSNCDLLLAISLVSSVLILMTALLIKKPLDFAKTVLDERPLKRVLPNVVTYSR